MSQGQEVPGHLVGGLEVVDPNAGGVGPEASRRHGDGRNLGLFELGQDDVGLAYRGRQDHAGDGAVDEPPHGGLFGRRGVHLALLEQQMRALAAALVQGAEQELTQVRSTGIAVEQPDPGALGPGQAPGGRIGGVFEVFDGSQDGGPGRIAHVRFAVHHA